MRIEDLGAELIQLYRLLRLTPDGDKRDAIKARIDLLVQDARESFVPQIVGDSDTEPKNR